MPESIAALASGAGASDAAVPATSAMNMSTMRVRYGARRTTSPRSLRPRPLRAAQAPAQVVATRRRAGGLVAGRHSPATSRSGALRLRKT